jgi:hypothetical protein
MDTDWWTTVMRAWHQDNEKSGLVIRMTNRFNGRTQNRCFASTEEAVSQLRAWLKELEDNAPA